MRRGVATEMEDAEAGPFRLMFGGRSISCRESLSDMISMVSLSRCDERSEPLFSRDRQALGPVRDLPARDAGTQS